MPSAKLTKTIIEAAIAGFEGQKKSIDAQIAELRAMLTGKPETESGQAQAKPTRRKFSAAAITRMREAQRLRWAKIKGEAKPPAPALAPKPKRKLSAAARATLAANLKKARAAKSAKAKSAAAPKPKRQISPEGMKKIIAANKKMWGSKTGCCETDLIEPAKRSQFCWGTGV